MPAAPPPHVPTERPLDGGARERLAVAAAELELDLLRWHELPALARDLLGDGADVGAIVRLAAFERDDDPRDVEAAFRDALVETGAPIDPDRWASACRLRDDYARRVTRGALAPHVAAAWMTELHRRVTFLLPRERRVGEALGITRVIALHEAFCELAPTDARRSVIEQEIALECARLCAFASG